MQNPMNVGDIQDWHTPQFRNKVVAQIEDAIRLAGNPIPKNSSEMESHVFQKAKTREEYLALVARLILHVKDINNQKDKRVPVVGNAMGPGNPMGPGGMLGQAGIPGQQGVPGQVGMPGQMGQGQMSQGQMGPGQMVAGQMGQGQMVAGQMGQGQMSQGQMGQGQMNQGQMVPGQMGQAQMGPGQMGQGPMNPGQMGPGPMNAGQIGQGPMGQGPMMGLQDPINALTNMANKSGPPQQQQGMPPNAQQFQMMRQRMAQQQAMQQHQMQQQQQQQQQPQLHRQDAFMVTSPGQPNPMNAPVQSYGNVMGPRGAMPGQGPMFNMQGPPQGYPQGQTGPPMGPVPSPQMPGSMMMPSPQSVSGHSPASQRPLMSAPSPSAPLNTPGNPGSVGAGNPGSVGCIPSPASRDPAEEAAYLEKLKQLSVYIEPLRKMINTQLQRDGNAKKKEVMKLTNLLEILCDPSKRLPMQTLAKCEGVLQRMDFTQTTTATPEQQMCQPLQDAISLCIKSPLLNHTLHHTFSPALTALHGPPIRAPSPPPDPPADDRPSDRPYIPDAIQGEVARLGRRFQVTFDPSHHPNSKALHLVCKIDDINLPAVPNMRLTIPENYPESSPYCDLSHDAYDATSFLEDIKKTHTMYVNQLSDQYSVTELLHAWEMSIRQAFAPQTAAVSG